MQHHVSYAGQTHFQHEMYQVEGPPLVAELFSTDDPQGGVRALPLLLQAAVSLHLSAVVPDHCLTHAKLSWVMSCSVDVKDILVEGGCRLSWTTCPDRHFFGESVRERMFRYCGEDIKAGSVDECAADLSEGPPTICKCICASVLITQSFDRMACRGG
jgi:hypothetical protein